jgi:DNA replication licensing factor MCM5
MSGFDDNGLFFVDTFSTDEIGGGNDPNKINFMAIQKKLKDFLRVFHTGNFNYIYRDALRNNYNSGRYWLEVDLKDVNSYDEELGEQVKKLPTEVLPLFEDAAKEIADEITRPRPEGEETVKPIQIMLRSEANPIFIRQLTSDQVAKLYKVSGIVVSASTIRAKATQLTIQCRSCRSTMSGIKVKPGMEGYALPRKCNADTSGRMNCPLDPFFVLPDSCKCVDSQTLKLQETPENVPNGEIPRHITLYIDKYLCDKIVPGNRVTVTGIYSIKRVGAAGRSSLKEKLNIGIRQPYLRVIGIQIDSDGSQTTTQQTQAANSNGIGSSNFLTNRIEEEEEFRRMAKSPNIYELIARSIAPSIWGFKDIKKAIACLLFGGSRKRLPDGLTRRGDINLLLLGDPGTAKSQLLKFVERVAPIAVYTSGKGSSAAGLTASVIRDPSTRNFMIEGGAMVLADGGVVCIDEFDKMREEDRVAIHEAMEQQTISIAKAGIVTTLNSRCSVLAAANSVFGRWDDLKGEDNIDFMPTILSRFDMIFIVKDEHNEARDATLARHVMNVHMNANVTNVNNKAVDGEISLENLRRYISFIRGKCGPRLGEEAAEKLKSQYVLMRSGTVAHERETGKRMSIPITVRQLEAVIRISESIAKMRLAPFAGDLDINEALRLFNVSTMSAAMTGSLTGVEGFTSSEDQEQLQRIEKQVRRRFVVGSQVSENAIIQDLVKQRYPEKAVYKVLQTMIRRGEVQHRAQRKLLFRIR